MTNSELKHAMLWRDRLKEGVPVGSTLGSGRHSIRVLRHRDEPESWFVHCVAVSRADIKLDALDIISAKDEAVRRVAKELAYLKLHLDDLYKSFTELGVPL